MNKNQGLQIVVVLIIWSLVLVFSKISSAESVYNFYFKPDEKSAEQTPQGGAAPLPMSSNLSKDGVKLVDERRSWKISGTIIPASHGNIGGSLALKFFPSRFLGFFAEGIYFNQTKGADISFAAGMEITPIHIDVFAAEDLVELGMEIGWSNFRNLVVGTPRYIYGNMDWFVGPKMSFNISRDLSIDTGARFSLSKSSVSYSSIGMSYKF